MSCEMKSDHLNHLKTRKCEKSQKVKLKELHRNFWVPERYPVTLRVGAHWILCGQSDAASHDDQKNSHLKVA